MKFSREHIRAWADVIYQQPTTESELSLWLNGPLKEFYPFEGLVLAYGELVAGEVKVTHMLTCGHEQSYVSQIKTTFDLKTRGSLKEWFRTQEPLLIDSCGRNTWASNFEIEEMRLFGFRNVAGHGVLNARMTAGTYFGFSNVREPLDGSHKDFLKLMAPNLHCMFLQCFAQQKNPSTELFEGLSPRRCEIVRLLATGLDDKSIARNLDMSEKTVRNQLSAIYSHVGIHKRAELIAILATR